jgi:hypothetical protein
MMGEGHPVKFNINLTKLIENFPLILKTRRFVALSSRFKYHTSIIDNDIEYDNIPTDAKL